VKTCSNCKISKSLDDFYIRPERKSVRSKCKECTKLKRKQYYIKNRNKQISYWINYKKSKYNVDPIFTLKEKLRNRFRRAFKQGYKKGSAIDNLGCSIEVFKEYIEKQFKSGMSWDNYGKWHIDHIKPLSSFNLQNIDELKQACHYSNLQPLWAEENFKKGSSYGPSTI
jgi:hypothetical protein